MSIGSVLVQPQRLARAEPARTDDAPLADFAKLAVGLGRDAIGGGHIVEQFEAAATAAAERVVANAEAGLDRARQRLGALAEAPVARIQALATELGSVSDPDDALAAVADVLGTLTAGAEALTIDHLRAGVAEVLDVIEQDLGLTPDFLEQEVWAFFDDLVERLEHVAPEPDAALRSNRLEVVGALRRLRRRAADAFEFPRLEVDHAAEDLLALIRQLGVSRTAGQVSCVGDSLTRAVHAARDALRAVPFTGLLPSVGAGVTPDAKTGDDVYLWYPSWLANNNRAPGLDILLVAPGDEVRVNKARTQIVQRNVFRADQLIASGTGLAWKDHPRLGDSEAPYSFGSIDADAMETLAWVSSIVQSCGEVIFNLASLEEGDIWSNLVGVTGGTLNAFWKGLVKEPEPWWLDGLIFRTLLVFPATFEGIHTEASSKGLMWLTIAGPDYAEMLTWKYVTNLARDLLLSVLTLVNNDPSASPHPRNRAEFDAVRHVVTMAIHNLFLLAFKRKNWGVMANASSFSPLLELLFLWSLLAGTLVGIVGGLAGSLLGEAIARDASGDALLKKMWWGIPQCVLLTMYWLYLQQEGSTDGGKFTPFSGSVYDGYPETASSPYKMPFDPAAVSNCYLGQGNQGLWSHNFNNVGQVYAYDFSLDEGAEILAARAGTVVAFSESVPDGQDVSQTTTAQLTTAIGAGSSPTTIDVNSAAGFQPSGALRLGASDMAYYTSISGTQFRGVTWLGGVAASAAAVGANVRQQLFSWNYVAIRHDVDETLAPAGPHPHDKGQGGNRLVTVGIYGHGMTGSVSASFQQRDTPVPTEAIVGSRVKQGMPIMRAGDTGISFHNHLHMHVVPDPAIGATPPFDYRTYGGAGNTLPYVFSDGPGDGVLTHFNWYVSGNTRRTS